MEEVFENGMSISKAGKKVGLKLSTAKLLVRNYKK